MKITKENVLVTDIETIKSYFLICTYCPSEERWYVFSINQYTNDILQFVKFLDNHYDGWWWITYNGLNFDFQVIEYIWRNFERWYDMSGLQIAHLIWEFSQKVIDDTNYNLFPPYHENDLTFKVIDVFKIQHFDNKNRRVGLKRLECEMDMEDIEDMKVAHDKEEFNGEEVEALIYYCKNDVKATWKNYLYIIGETDNALYKGNNQIEIREALTEEFKFNCINYSNSKYGDEIIKHLYCKEKDISYQTLPRSGTFLRTLYFKKGIPSYVCFSTPELKAFLQRMKKKEIKASEDFEEDIKFKDQVYTFGLGGLHNKIKNKKYEADNEYAIVDADVTSYYPATILNNGYSPQHLDRRAFLKSYRWVYDERVRLKPLAKKDSKIKGITSGYKEALVAAYGKMRDKTNWMHDPQAGLNICIAGELSILMLIEMCELAGFSCIMANTDGATFFVKRTELDLFNITCQQWTNTTHYPLEFFNFKKIFFLSVNDYIAEYENHIDPIWGNIKCKGKFLLYTELHKNKSFRVIPLALKHHLIDGEGVEEFINSHNNIYDFCARSSCGKQFYHATFDRNGQETQLFRVLRYYVAKEGAKIMKMVREGNDTGANNTNVSPAEKLKATCNNLGADTHSSHLENTDRQWYVDEVNSILFRLTTGRKPKNVNKNPNQTNLFD